MRFCVLLKLFFTEMTLFYLFLAHKYELVSKRKEVPAFISCLLLHFIGFLWGDRWMNGTCCALHKRQHIVFKQTNTYTLVVNCNGNIYMISSSTNDSLCASETMNCKCVFMYSWLVACNWMFHETMDGRSPRKWPKIECFRNFWAIKLEICIKLIYFRHFVPYKTSFINSRVLVKSIHVRIHSNEATCEMANISMSIYCVCLSHFD